MASIHEILHAPPTTQYLTDSTGDPAFACNIPGASGPEEIKVVLPDGTQVYYNGVGTPLDVILPDGSHKLELAEHILDGYTLR